MSFVNELESILRERQKDLPEGSYSSELFKSGLDRILRKIGEESGEVIIAAKNQDNEELKNEIADLLFHLLVLLREKNLSFDDVIEVLKARTK